MCGRYTVRAAPKALQDHFKLSEEPTLFPRFNAAPPPTVPAGRAGQAPLKLPEARAPSPRSTAPPTKPARAVRGGGGGPRELALRRWGVNPPWARDATSSFINARSETAAAKPAFRHALRKRR